VFLLFGEKINALFSIITKKGIFNLSSTKIVVRCAG
jgi:hypothetical protein